jgi:hypothetical protein
VHSASPRSSARSLTRAAYAADGKWRHFGNAMATANHVNAKLSTSPNSSSPRMAAAAHLQAGNASGK